MGKRGERETKIFIFLIKTRTKWIIIFNCESVQLYSTVPLIQKIRNNYPYLLSPIHDYGL